MNGGIHNACARVNLNCFFEKAVPLTDELAFYSEINPSLMKTIDEYSSSNGHARYKVIRILTEIA